MLHLDLPEIELVIDKSGRVADAHPADDSYPHTIIEMFMVEANDAVASLLDRLSIPFMRRIHPEPDNLSMQNLSKLVRAFGFALPRNPDRKDVQDLLAAVKGKDSSFAVNIAVLRSFEKAQYAPLNIGHFALASTHYCHFTSPIRRYADLIVHRLLEYYLHNRLDLAKSSSAELDLTEIGKHITFTEQRAEDAEDELKTVLILQMLSKRIGEKFDGIVSGLTNFGVFVQSKKYGIEGLIQMGDLGDDVWKYDKKTQCIAGVNSGASIHLGRAMKVHIASVNVPARQLNLTPAELLVNLRSRRKKAEPARKRKKDRTRKRMRNKK
jgi:ribonuclease R